MMYIENPVKFQVKRKKTEILIIVLYIQNCTKIIYEETNIGELKRHKAFPEIFSVLLSNQIKYFTFLAHDYNIIHSL